MPQFVPMPTITALYTGLLGLLSILIALVGFRCSHTFGMQAGGSNGIFRTIGAAGTALLTLVVALAHLERDVSGDPSAPERVPR